MDEQVTIEKVEAPELELAQVQEHLNLPATVVARELLPAPLEKLREVAEVLSLSMNVPVAFQGHPEKCLSLAYQAALWRMDPVMVASKAYLVKVKGDGGGERIAYEAQLIAALVNAKAPIQGLPKIRFSGEGSKRFCTVSVLPKGEKEWLHVSSPTIGQIVIKNSPLWFTDPDQQLSYYTQRAMARRHFPHILLGVYSIDEMQMVEVRDVSGPRVDPYADAEPQEIEAELVAEGQPEPIAEPEPSGGPGWKPSDAGTDDRPAEEQAPEDMPEVEKWVAEQRERIVALRDPVAVAADAEAVVADKRFKRLITYRPQIARAFDRSIKKHLEDLKAS